MKKEEYAEYLKSKKWRGKIKQLINRYGGKYCFECGSKKDIDTHHKTYRRIGREKLKDLIFLCREHHFARHKNPKQIERYKNDRRRKFRNSKKFLEHRFYDTSKHDYIGGIQAQQAEIESVKRRREIKERMKLQSVAQ